MAQFKIRINQSSSSNGSEFILVELAGELDLATSPTLERELDSLVPSQKPIVLDMAQVGFIDASGIGVMLAVADRARATGSGIVVRRPSRIVAQIMGLLQLNGALPVENGTD